MMTATSRNRGSMVLVIFLLCPCFVLSAVNDTAESLAIAAQTVQASTDFNNAVFLICALLLLLIAGIISRYMSQKIGIILYIVSIGFDIVTAGHLTGSVLGSIGTLFLIMSFFKAASILYLYRYLI